MPAKHCWMFWEAMTHRVTSGKSPTPGTHPPESRQDSGSDENSAQVCTSSGESEYHLGMAFVIKLSPDDTEALREQAAREHRSMHEVAALAIKTRIALDRRAQVLDELFDEVATEDAELLDRLAR